jgi:hypothetical protein
LFATQGVEGCEGMLNCEQRNVLDRLRDECLNVQLFFTLADAREKLEQWRQDYNRVRPHSSLGDQSPEEFANGWRPIEITPHSDEFARGTQLSYLRHETAGETGLNRPHQAES